MSANRLSKGWAIVSPQGTLLIAHAAPTKRECIQRYLKEQTRVSYWAFYIAAGWDCVRCELREVRK